MGRNSGDFPVLVKEGGEEVCLECVASSCCWHSPCLLRKAENKSEPQLPILLAALYKLLLPNDWELSISGEGTRSLLKKLPVRQRQLAECGGPRE